MKILALFILSALAFTPSLSAQSRQADALTISGEVKTPLSFSVNELKKLPQTTVRSKDKSGKEHTYTGVSLHLLLQKAGAASGEELRGKNMANYVLISAADGYSVLFSLAETDPSFTGRTIILATHIDTTLLPDSKGPLQLIVENEMRPTRFIWQVNSIRVLAGG